MPKKSIYIIIFILINTSILSFSFNIIKLTGSDLGMGIGARAISMGGAFTAVANDSSACFWNPAGLVNLNKNELTIMTDFHLDFNNFTIQDKELSYLSLVIKDKKNRLAIGISRINRLTYEGSGNWSGYPSHLIDLSMINVEKDYQGWIYSQTIDKRTSIAIALNKRLSIGLTCIDFKCIANFFSTTDGKLPDQQVGYRTFDLGTLYKPTNNLNIGIMYKNVRQEHKPKYITVGVAYFKNKKIYSIDIEKIFGQYGENERRKCKFLFIRFGKEWYYNSNIKLRYGIILPLQSWTDTLGDMRKNLPEPKFDATFGIGYNLGSIKIDFVIFGDPARSYIKHKPILSYSLSTTYNF